MEGWLEKEPERVGSRRRRYFVAVALGSSVHTEYFVDAAQQVRKGEFEVDTTDADAVALLPASSSSSSSSTTSTFAFSVKEATGHRRYVLLAATAKERDDWMAFFKGQHAANLESSDRFVGMGVSADCLRAFAKEHQLAGLRTEQVCQQIVMEKTKAQQCAYIQLLKSKVGGLAHVGRATVFVSHAWRYDINDVFAVMLDYADKQETADGGSRKTYFWFDLFCNNQHKAVSYPFEWWCTTFRDQIRSIGEVLLVMSPWQDPIPLTRAWCLWEIYCSLQSQTPLRIGLPPKQEGAFLEGVTSNLSAVLDALVKIDAERSEAFKKEDRDNIFAAVRASEGGFHGVNMQIKDRLREWYIDKALELAEAAVATERLHSSRTRPVKSSDCDGDGDGDRDRDRDRDSESQEGEGSDDGGADPGQSLYNLAAALYSLGEYQAALRFYERCLAVRVDEFGEDSPRVGNICHQLGSVLNSLGALPEALEMFERSLEIKLAAVGGESHPDTAGTLNNMAQVLAGLGDYEAAMDLLNRALAINLALEEFAEHPETAAMYNNLGVVCMRASEEAEEDEAASRAFSDRALAMFENALRIRLAALGENHPDTAATYANMGNLHMSQGRPAQARDMYEKDLKTTLAVLGEQHSSAAASYNNLASAYEELHDYPRATELYERALAVSTAALGEDNIETARYMGNLADLLLKAGSRAAEDRAAEDRAAEDRARTLLRRCVQVMSAALGPDHPAIAFYRSRLGVE